MMIKFLLNILEPQESFPESKNQEI